MARHLRGGRVQSLPVVMLVEDEKLIQGMLQEALSEGGFHPTVAQTASEAIELLNNKHAEYRALLTDIHLPDELTGWDIARTARELDPAFPVVHMTGSGSAHEWASQGVPNSILLTKPSAPAQLIPPCRSFLMEALCRRVRSVHVQEPAKSNRRHVCGHAEVTFTNKQAGRRAAAADRPQVPPAAVPLRRSAPSAS